MSEVSVRVEKMGKVSVIIPAYNSSRWIAQTIRSVQEQTYSNLEIIVVDDGSTDETVQIIKTINDLRLSIYCQAHIGVSAARNVGIEHATGEFIAFLDADDLWREDMIENHVSALQDNRWAGVAYCWRSFIDEEDNRLWDRPPAFFEGNVYRELIKDNFLACGALVARRNAVRLAGTFDTGQTYGEDYDYWLRLALHSQFVVVPQYQFFHRRWKGSTTAMLSCKSRIESRKVSIFLRKEKGIQMAPEYTDIWNSVYYMTMANMELELCLEEGKNYQRVYQAFQMVCKSIWSQPQVLMQKNAIKTMAKFLFTLGSSQQIACNITKWYRDPKRRRAFSYLLKWIMASRRNGSHKFSCK